MKTSPAALGRRVRACLPLAAALAVAGCGGWSVRSERATEAEGGAGGESSRPPPGDYPKGFRVVGTRIEDDGGNRMFLRGANRSGTEYKCIQGGGFFDGPDDDASIAAISSWGLNAVRIPLNETCWLALNGAPSRYSGQRYKDSIIAYVERLHHHKLVPILELHWAAPGERLATALTPMPNADHSVEFWRDVARTFLDDEGVIFEPYNEPFPDLNRDTPEAWTCWRDGCDVTEYGSSETYAAAGMQALVDAIREAGSRHLILLGGIQYSNELSGWLSHKPDDPLDNLAAAWHIYDFNECNQLGCWSTYPLEVSSRFPLVATEIGQSDCSGETMLKPLMEFLDTHGSGYLAWSWNVLGDCVPMIPRTQQGAPWSLITDYVSPEPNSDYARTFYEHVQGVLP